MRSQQGLLTGDSRERGPAGRTGQGKQLVANEDGGVVLGLVERVLPPFAEKCLHGEADSPAHKVGTLDNVGHGVCDGRGSAQASRAIASLRIARVSNATDERALLTRLQKRVAG